MAKKQLFLATTGWFFIALVLAFAPASLRAASPAMAWTGSSYGVVEVRQSGNQYNIVFNRLDATGKKLQAEATVLSAGVPLRFPTIHWTGLTYLVFWVQDDGSGAIIASRRIDPVGTIASPIISIHRSNNPVMSFESLAVEQNPHHFALSWEEKLRTDQSRSMFLRVDTAGSKLMEPMVVSETEPTLPTPAPTISPQPGPTIARAEQLQRPPSSGQPPYPSAIAGTAQSIESRPGPIAYAYPPPTTTSLTTLSPFRPTTTEASTLPTPFYAYSPAPTFNPPSAAPRTIAYTPSPVTAEPNAVALPTTQATTTDILQLHAGDLIRGSSPSVWQYGDDGKRRLFPDDFTFKSWSNKYEWVMTLDDSRLANISEGTPMLIFPGYAIVKFRGDSTLYRVARIDVLTPMRNTAEARERYGTNWKNRIHVYPKELKARYSIEIKAQKNGVVAKKIVKRAIKKMNGIKKPAAKKPMAKPTPKVPKGRTGQTVFQPINVRSRNVL
jgi:hypothetical protein